MHQEPSQPLTVTIGQREPLLFTSISTPEIAADQGFLQMIAVDYSRATQPMMLVRVNDSRGQRWTFARQYRLTDDGPILTDPTAEVPQ